MNKQVNERFFNILDYDNNVPKEFRRTIKSSQDIPFVKILIVSLVLHLAFALTIKRVKVEEADVSDIKSLPKRFARLILEGSVNQKRHKKKDKKKPEVVKESKIEEPQQAVKLVDKSDNKNKAADKPEAKQDKKAAVISSSSKGGHGGGKDNMEEMGLLKLIGGISAAGDKIKGIDKVNILSKGDETGRSSKGNSTFKKYKNEDMVLNIKAKEEMALSRTDVGSKSKSPLPSADKKTAVLHVNYNNKTYDDARSELLIERKIQEYEDGLKFCYDKSLRKFEGISGDILLKFTILPSGSTGSINTSSGTINDRNLSNCIVELVSRWKFPLSDSESVVITYPLQFKANT